MKPEVLRNKYPKFVYSDYSYRISGNDLEIFFDFRIEPDIVFKPRIVVGNVDKSIIEKVGERVMNNLVFNLGLVEMISYWKATCSKVIDVECGRLDDFQIEWFKDLIRNGMGQFFFENEMGWDVVDSLEIMYGKSKDSGVFEGKLKNRVLLPIGGGKDSIVSLELLKDKFDVRCFSLDPRNPAKEIMKIGECENPVVVRREIDPKLLELNRKGFLNGHTPFSAYLAFLTVLVGVIFDYEYIAVSNERSSNEGNVEYMGHVINHQYSKSFDFEKKFRDYSKRYLAENVEYFSLLRPLYEIQIAELFAGYFDKYGKVFLSCNEAFKTDSGSREVSGKWCCECSKCLFVFSILYPFVDTDKLVDVFGSNLFEKKSLLGLMEELTGESRFKPFECVGTKQESLVAFYLSLKKAEKEGENLPYLLEQFRDTILSKHQNLGKESEDFMKTRSDKHGLPEEFQAII